MELSVLDRSRADGLILVRNTGLFIASGDMSLNERRICNTITYYAKPTLLTKQMHELPLYRLMRDIGFNSKNTDALKACLDSLLSTRVTWSLRNAAGEEIEHYAGNILAEYKIKNGTLFYQYPMTIAQRLATPNKAFNFPMELQSKFNSKHQAAIVELFYYALQEAEESDFIADMDMLKMITGTNMPERRYRYMLEDAQKFLSDQKTTLRVEIEEMKQGRKTHAFRIRSVFSGDRGAFIWKHPALQTHSAKKLDVDGFSELTEEMQAIAHRLHGEFKVKPMEDAVALLREVIARGVSAEEIEKQFDSIIANNPKYVGRYTKTCFKNMRPGMWDELGPLDKPSRTKTSAADLAKPKLAEPDVDVVDAYVNKLTKEEKIRLGGDFFARSASRQAVYTMGGQNYLDNPVFLYEMGLWLAAKA